jgi:hypothetical protein
MEYTVNNNVLCFMRDYDEGSGLVYSSYDPDYGNVSTVYDLMALANDALGGRFDKPYPVDLADITDALTAINEAYDECRIGYFKEEAVVCTSQAVAGSGSNNTVSGSFMDNTSISAHPNPFNEVAVIQFTVPEDIRVTLDVYNLQGQHIENLYTGIAEKDVIHTSRFHAKNRHNQSGYVYVLRTVHGVKTGKMIMIK